MKRAVGIYASLLVLIALLASCGGNDPATLGEPSSQGAQAADTTFSSDDFERPDGTVRWTDLSPAERNAVRSLPFVQSSSASLRTPTPLPTEFDAREQWPGLITPPLDQGTCGDCWAFSTTTAVSDRIRIVSTTGALSNGVKFDFEYSKSPSPDCSYTLLNGTGGLQVPDGLSPYQLADCDPRSNGCHGGSIHSGYIYASQSGLVPLSAYRQRPVKTSSPTAGPCETPSPNATTYTFSTVLQVTDLADLDAPPTAAQFIQAETDIMQAVYTGGPVSVALDMPPNFRSFFKQNPQGVLTKALAAACPPSGCGGHAVVIVGWGVENGTKYWLLRNSWGPLFADCGFFRLERGVNCIGVENDAWGATGFSPL